MKSTDFIGNVKINQPGDGYHFTSDSVALAEFAECKKTDIVLDAGCGNGVISLIINERCKPHKIIAVDIVGSSAEAAKGNAFLNGMDNIEIRCADVRDFHKEPVCVNGKSTSAANIFDTVVCNPPYFSTGLRSRNNTRSAARHDDNLTLAELVKAAARLLKHGGSLYLCYPANLTAHAVNILESGGFRVKKLHFISNEKGIYLTLFHAKKGGGHSTAVTASANTKALPGFNL